LLHTHITFINYSAVSVHQVNKLA